jgi:N-acyl homoserine lactone hydrolase
MTATARRLWALDAPRMTLDAGELVLGAEGSVTIPLPGHLIEHERGLILFDTSMNPLVCDDPRLVFGDTPVVSMIDAHPEQRIDRQIRLLGFEPSDVTHVILSHTHCDHAGGLYLFPQAKFYAGPGEFEWAANPPAELRHLFLPEDYMSHTVQAFGWNTVSSPVTDLFGDGAIQIYHLPGHTPGELSVLVKLPSQNIVLTGDTVHLREAVQWEAPDPSDWDHDIARESIRKLKQLTAENNAAMWISHEPRDWEDFGGARVALT